MSDMDLDVGDELEVKDVVFPNEEVRQQLSLYLQREYTDVAEGNERRELEEDWEEWRRTSIGKPKDRVKTTPWEGASNMVTPFTFSNVNGVYSHLQAAIAERKPRWQVTSHDKKYADHAKAWQHWLNAMMVSPLHVNITEKDSTMLFDIARMGTQFAEVPWTTRRVQFKRMGRDGVPEVIDKTVYDGPDVVPHRLEDVYVRSHWTVQDAPYIGFGYSFTKQDLKTEEYNGFFEDVERVFAFGADQERSRSNEAEYLGVNPDNFEDLTEIGAPYRIVKWYVRWDADEDGIPEDLIVWQEPESGIILRAEWCELGKRPIANGGYVKVPYWIYSLGVAAMLYRVQEEIDTMHNIGVNSLHISTLQMYVSSRGSGIGPNEKFFPLKNIQVDDVQRDFMPIKFPNASAETITRENMAQQYGRTVTGISEVQLGMPDTTAKSGTSPTLQQFLAQQGNKILRRVIASVADFYGELGQYASLQLVANSDRVLGGNQPLLKLAATDEDRDKIREVLMMDVEDLPQTFQFSVKTTEADKTEDARRQFLSMKHQLMSQYMQQGMQVVQMLDSPQVQQMPTLREFLLKMYVAQTNLMEESLALFDVQKAEEYLPNVESQELMLQIIETMRAPQIAAAKRQLEEAHSGEGQGASGPAGESGIFRPGLTAGENDSGNAGNAGDTEMVEGQRGGGNVGAPAQ